MLGSIVEFFAGSVNLAFTHLGDQHVWERACRLFHYKDESGTRRAPETTCILADTFLRADAVHTGYAAVCWGDYAWAPSFNEKIVMVRDKILMEGNECFNHRYLWKG